VTTKLQRSVTTFMLGHPRALRAYLKLRTPSYTVRQYLTNGMGAGARSVRKPLDRSGLTSDYSESYKRKRNG
jgi:hypothetical protein